MLFERLILVAAQLASPNQRSCHPGQSEDVKPIFLRLRSWQDTICKKDSQKGAAMSHGNTG